MPSLPHLPSSTSTTLPAPSSSPLILRGAQSDGVLFQQCEDGQRRSSRFRSIARNEREQRYFGSKIELHGLFRTLRALRVHIVGVTNLIVEMDAQYVKGVLKNPDVQPDVAVNRSSQRSSSST